MDEKLSPNLILAFVEEFFGEEWYKIVASGPGRDGDTLQEIKENEKPAGELDPAEKVFFNICFMAPNHFVRLPIGAVKMLDALKAVFWEYVRRRHGLTGFADGLGVRKNWMLVTYEQQPFPFLGFPKGE